MGVDENYEFSSMNFLNVWRALPLSSDSRAIATESAIDMFLSMMLMPQAALAMATFFWASVAVPSKTESNIF